MEKTMSNVIIAQEEAAYHAREVGECLILLHKTADPRKKESIQRALNEVIARLLEVTRTNALLVWPD
jgi:hypothetical protein